LRLCTDGIPHNSAAGHVSKPLTELLLKKGHDVTIVGRSPKNLEGLVKLGANTAIGDMSDPEYLSTIGPRPIQDSELGHNRGTLKPSAALALAPISNFFSENEGEPGASGVHQLEILRKH
jgi:nucleoside-diphosphate-sugar epimerase